ncbi:MAG: pyrroline-5-carboxylate reductase [Bacteroidia bacterium]|nr:pyrroline-5-carboxylate reductase [Bacteroidia bacterium]MDW8159432.1 pyrroline-5-carboxylate reductase [Bacteroidia bacterium]
MNILIIGGGNLGCAIAKGLKEAEPNYNITVTRRNPQKITYLKSLGIQISDSNTAFIGAANYVMLAVKPHQVVKVLEEIRPFIEHQLLISLVTGFSLQELKLHLGPQVYIARAMPNTAISQRESMTCISTANLSEQQKQAILTLFNKLGQSVFIEEHLMDAATVLGACGLAFALRYIRASMQGGIQIGFDSQTALKIAAQTVRGAAALILNQDSHPESEIDKVTTPQGCTIAGLNEMEHQGFSSALIKGILSSFHAIDGIQHKK